ncbi:MAG: hypothetical protein AAF682_00160 [Planctomycetota bacterium]
MKKLAVGVVVLVIVFVLIISRSNEGGPEAAASARQPESSQVSLISLGSYEGRLAPSARWTQRDPSSDHRIAEFELPSPNIDRASKGLAAMYAVSNTDAESLIMTWVYQIEQSEPDLASAASACDTLLSGEDSRGWLRVRGRPAFVDNDDEWNELEQKESIPAEWQCSIAARKIGGEVLLLRLIGPAETIDDAEDVGAELLASVSTPQGSSRH